MLLVVDRDLEVRDVVNCDADDLFLRVLVFRVLVHVLQWQTAILNSASNASLRERW